MKSIDFGIVSGLMGSFAMGFSSVMGVVASTGRLQVAAGPVLSTSTKVERCSSTPKISMGESSDKPTIAARATARMSQMPI